MSERLEILKGLVEMLDDEAGATATAPTPQFGGFGTGEPKTLSDRSVFLVHGHDRSLLETTARFLQKLDLDVTILHEKPNSGRTIIEKFIDHSNVGFAVVLLTGDDRGGAKSVAFEDQKPRARQNVILELGFFLGKLGRNRVCAIFESGVEIPSDYSGVLYVQHDPADAWRFALAKELKEAGLKIDLNKAL